MSFSIQHSELSTPQDGAVAQLGERLICIQEVVGSIPISSTSFRSTRRAELRPGKPARASESSNEMGRNTPRALPGYTPFAAVLHGREDVRSTKRRFVERRSSRSWFIDN